MEEKKPHSDNLTPTEAIQNVESNESATIQVSDQDFDIESGKSAKSNIAFDGVAVQLSPTQLTIVMLG